jgi:hypothetical protein
MASRGGPAHALSRDDHWPRWRTAVAFAAAAFVLHWAWETAHGVAYVETDMPLLDRLWHCLPMAVVDTAWSGAVVLVGIIASRSLRRPWLTWAVGVAAGALTATWVEHAALQSGRWTYNARMPILPVIEVGLWPVLQMSLLPPLALLMAAKFSRTWSRYASVSAR